MTKSINQLADETLADLKSKLLENTTTTSKEGLIEIIKICLNTAFSQIGNESRKDLFKKLSLSLHPDKMSTSPSLKELYDYLAKNDASGIPFQELTKYKNRGFFNKIGSDPLNAIPNLLFPLWNKFQSMFFAYKRYPQPTVPS